MADLGGDRHADGEVLARHREVAAALVATPVQQAFIHAQAAHELRAMLAVGGEKRVLGPHRAGDADPDRFLAQGRGEGAQLAGALERDGLGVEGSGEIHRAIQRHELRRIAGEIG